MTMQSRLMFVSVIALLLLVSTAFCQIPFDFTYQARLADSTGSPMPNGNYPMEFRFFSQPQGGLPVWTEPIDVPTSNGYFSVMMEPPDLNALGGPLYLEVLVNDEIMIPRAPLTSVPFSAVSQRVNGDIQTRAGSLRMMEPVDDLVGFEVLTATGGNSLKLMEPVDSLPVVELKAEPTLTSFKMMDPVDKREAFEILTSMAGNSAKLMEPVDKKPLIEMSGGADGGANIYMFNPQPEPPAHLIALNASPSSGASFKMFNPQPEPPADPLLEMKTTQYGAGLAMAAPQAGGFGVDITDPMFEVITDSSGGTINLYDEIGKVMGWDPTPFTPGGILYLIDPAADDTNMFLGSDGYLYAQKGNFGDNSNTGEHSVTIGSGNEAAGDNCFAGGQVAFADDDNCFIWSDYPVGPSVLPLHTSAANQFIVRATGGVKFYTNATMTSGVQLTPGASAWSTFTALNAIDNAREANGNDVLNKIEQLPIKSYSLKSEAESIEHIGPMAGDFNRLFDTGNDDEHLSALDQSGVALAGVKALLEKIERLEARIAELEAAQE
jgi:hypothetical protein